MRKRNYKSKNCVVCLDVYIPTTGQSKTCGLACRKKYRAEYVRQYYIDNRQWLCAHQRRYYLDNRQQTTDNKKEVHDETVEAVIYQLCVDIFDGRDTVTDLTQELSDAVFEVVTDLIKGGKLRYDADTEEYTLVKEVRDE